MKNKLKLGRFSYNSKYVDSLVKQILPLASKMENDFSSGIAIYGAGFVGTWAAQYLKSIGANVLYFIDRDPFKKDTYINGIKVVSTSDPIIIPKTSIFIAARHAVNSIQTSLGNDKFNLLSFDGYFVVKNYDKLCFVRDNYFTDQKSITTFNAILAAMVTGSIDSCLDVMEKDMYFSLPEFSGNFEEIFVDAGAFVGDTVERFIWENLGTFKHLYAFEPGHRQFLALENRLTRLLPEWAINEKSIDIINAGLASENNKMAFSFLDDSPIRHALTSNPTDNNQDDSEKIDVVTLDSFLEGKPVTFIKADVEGMEMDLLRGAQGTIKKYKPKLALCVYHYPSDLIEVAEFVRSLVPEYLFQLRLHAPIFGDFVLYCYCV